MAQNSISFKHVSVGNEEVWATTNSGLLLRRIGVSSANPVGFSWDTGIIVIYFVKVKLININIVMIFREIGSI